MLTLYHTIRTALLDLSLHKVRSGMAAIGVMFGVASVISMMAVSEGAKQKSLSQIISMGVDNIIVRSIEPADGGDTAAGSTEEQSYRQYGITHRDLQHLQRTFDQLRYAVGLCIRRWPVRDFAGREVLTPVMATEADYLALSRSNLVSGRFLQHMDNLKRRRVCVLGANTARTLFAFHDPMGKQVQINGQWFRVVGLVRNRGEVTAFGSDAPINDHIFIPLETARSFYGDVRSLDGGAGFAEIELDAMVMQVEERDAIMAVSKRLRNYLRKTHTENDYDLVVPLALLKQKAATQKVFSIVMGAIAGISLLVGGIGIMNIMLANVSERRKEIGMRRALGARRKDVLVQFLVESMTLTGIGGLVGIGLGYVLTGGISHYAAMPTAVPAWSVFLGFGVSVGVGMAFGLWPAYSAASVNPIDALRFE